MTNWVTKRLQSLLCVPSQSPVLSSAERILLSAAAALVAAGWILAACLIPDPRGHGTHQQLGLPPCTIRVVLGLPCPACGLTTSASLLMRGQIAAAGRVNPASLILYPTATLCAMWFACCGIYGRWWCTPRPEPLILAVLLFALAVLLASWVWQLAFAMNPENVPPDAGPPLHSALWGVFDACR